MIPDYQTLMRPVLECASKGEVSIREVVQKLAIQFQLTEAEQAELLPSGKQPKFTNRVNWAKTYLKQAGLIRSTVRGCFEITNRGRDAIAAKNIKIDNVYLANYSEFQDFKNKSKDVGKSESNPSIVADVIEAPSTPDEVLRKAHQSINEALAIELLASIRECSPTFFENLIIDLLLAMGYGGTSEDAGRAIGRSGDNGVDGVIDQDPLGVDQIYIQAKRYQEGNTVGAADIRDFYGSLSLKKANKGIFVTTSTFTSSALQTAKDLGHRIVLIDGVALTKLMIRYNIGCRDQELIHIKKIDEDYFDVD